MTQPPDSDVADVRRATGQLFGTVRRLTDGDARGPSLLPGWSRGHVLTHLARNADGLGNLLASATDGVERSMYPSRQARDAAIEAGSGRSAEQLLADLESAAERFEAACATVPPAGWDRQVVAGGGRQVPAAAVPWLRQVEVEIHHVDLGAGYRPADWPPEFVRRALDEVAGQFAASGDLPALTLRATDSGRSWSFGTGGPVISGSDHAALAWLTGRSAGDGLTVDGGGPLPRPPNWR